MYTASLLVVMDSLPILLDGRTSPAESCASTLKAKRLQVQNPNEPSTCTCTRSLRFILRLEKVFVCTSRHYSVGTTNYSDRSAHSMVSYEMHQQSDRGPATVVCDTCPARSRNFRSCIWRVHGPSQYPCRVPHRHLRCPNVPKQCAKALAIAH